MTFLSAIENQPSRISAHSEIPSKVLLMPADKVRTWCADYPAMNRMFFSMFKERYDELFDMVGNVINKKLDERLEMYLREKAKNTSF